MKSTLLLLLSLLFGCAPLISVHQLRNDTISKYKTEEGIFYSLPKHAFDVTITYNVVTDKKPQHSYTQADISKGLFHPFPFYAADQKTTSIKSITITPVISPDPEASYFAKLNSRKLFEEVKLDITLNGYNQISSLGSASTSQLTPIVTTIASTIGGLFFQGALPATIGTQLTESNKQVFENASFADKSKTFVANASANHYIIAIHSMYKQTKAIKFDTLTANSIEQLNLLNNEYLKLVSIPDLNDFSTRLSILKERIKLHEEYLGGTRTVSEGKLIYRYEPTTKNYSKDTILNLEGENYKVKLNFNASNFTFRKSFENFETKDVNEGSGVFYRIPMQTVLEVKVQKDSKSNPGTFVDVKTERYDVTVPQFGITRSLPPTKGYTRNFSYALDPVTGALKSYSTTHKGISNEDAKSVSATIGELEGMRNKKLERYNKELELKIKQLELNQKLDSLDSKK